MSFNNLPIRRGHLGLAKRLDVQVRRLAVLDLGKLDFVVPGFEFALVDAVGPFRVSCSHCARTTEMIVCSVEGRRDFRLEAHRIRVPSCKS